MIEISFLRNIGFYIMILYRYSILYQNYNIIRVPNSFPKASCDIEICSHFADVFLEFEMDTLYTVYAIPYVLSTAKLSLKSPTGPVSIRVGVFCSVTQR